ncbi:MAG: NAD(P)-dependent oxidoreductase [Planctomycetota bacterium]|jgi:D-3-phosphoglycerate dehydrogenase
MKVLIADKMSENAVNRLEKAGCTVNYCPDLKSDEIPGSYTDAEILIVRSTKVTKDNIDKLKQLSLIIRAGAGVNTIDVKYASSKGIYVANCPGKNTAAVAELTIGLLISADRRIADAAAEMRCGNWKKKEFGKASGLKGKTLGVIGCGMIGRAVIERAKALEMNIVVWSRSMNDDKAEKLGVSNVNDPIDVARQSDAVTLHIASSGKTKGMVNKNFLNAMKDGAILINAARGEIVNTDDLKDAIKNKGIKAALDVFENEPSGGEAIFNDTELAGIVTATPHIGASTDQAAEAIAGEAVRIVETFINSGIPANAVNLCAESTACFNLVVRHYNKVGVLAGVLDKLKEEGINVEEVQNTIFDGADAACCTMLLDSRPSDVTTKAIKNTENILQVVLASIK